MNNKDLREKILKKVLKISDKEEIIKITLSECKWEKLKFKLNKASLKCNELKKEKKAMIETMEILSNKRIIKGLRSALEDFKKGRFTVLSEDKEDLNKNPKGENGK